MALRVKRHWFREGAQRAPDAIASALAVTVWRASLDGLQRVRKANFVVDVGPQFIAVLSEFVCFLVSVADRIAYRDAHLWREPFTVALATRLSEIYAENLDHLVGPAVGEPSHQGRFVALLNQRMAEYAEFEYDELGPDFGFQRLFGSCIAEAMRDPDDRRWALDQIMAVQAPEAVEIVERAMRGLLGIDSKPKRRALAGGD